jgi:hypothetical protein
MLKWSKASDGIVVNNIQALYEIWVEVFGIDGSPTILIFLACVGYILLFLRKMIGCINKVSRDERPWITPFRPI